MPRRPRKFFFLQKSNKAIKNAEIDAYQSVEKDAEKCGRKKLSCRLSTEV